MCINLVIADPHPIMQEALVSFLGDEQKFSIQSCVDNGHDALVALEKYSPQILVMDLSLTHCSSIYVLEEIRKNNIPVQTVLFTNGGINDILRSIDLGVSGIVSREKPKMELAECIVSVSKGEKFLDREMTQKALTLLLDRKKKSELHSRLLTAKELLVAQAVIEGLPNKKVAHKLFIQEGTVKLHLHKIYQKLNCPGRMSLKRCLEDVGLT